MTKTEVDSEEPLEVRHPLIRQIAELLYEATGEHLLIVHPDLLGWRQIPADTQTPCDAPFCQLIQRTPEGSRRCRMCHIMMTVSACSGGPTEQRCHAGATVLVCPVPNPTFETYAILSTCMFTSEQDWEAVQANGRRAGTDETALRKAFQKVLRTDERPRRVLLAAMQSMNMAIQVIRQNKDLRERMRKAHTAKGPRVDLERFLGETEWANTAQARAAGAEGEKPLLVHIVCELVRQRPDLPLSVTELAAAARLTPNHFTTLFRAHTGRPFTEFLTEQRIARAKKLLLNPTLSINEVATMSGYDDPGYFTRRFREMTELSPRQWRNRQVGTDAPV
jgi:AraC-like DNA-binding protein/ligand-binding sensor protein